MKKIMSVLLAISIIFLLSTHALASGTKKVNDIYEKVGKYLYETVKEPTVGSVGGEWAVMGIARSDISVPDEYFEKYYQAVAKYVKSCNGVLHNKKYTEYSRVIVALTAIGKNPEEVEGYNLLTPLGDYEKTIWQGINGAVWALIALDSGGYDMPSNADARIQATREMYVNHILERQTSVGGWALSGEAADPDITAMAIQALSGYQDNYKVKSAMEKALACLSEMQNQDGGFLSYETGNSESSAQVLVALCELGIPIDDKRFVKNGNSVLDNLLTYYDNKGGFKHIYGDKANLMATEQCFYSLVALKRVIDGKRTLYDMTDAGGFDSDSVLYGNPKKIADIKKIEVIDSDKTFFDTLGHKHRAEIEALASRGIVNGKTEGLFEPDTTMSRAEFATIITRGLGLLKKGDEIFADVSKEDWFYEYVGTAYSYGIIKGVSENKFNPNGTITREEAATMITRAAGLCGIDTYMDSVQIRDVLSQFFDYVNAADWSQSSLAFCYNEKILDDSDMDISPKKEVNRAEIAYMLYNMLSLAGLL